jgi:hypothetical protein
MLVVRARRIDPMPHRAMRNSHEPDVTFLRTAMAQQRHLDGRPERS